MKLSPRYKDNTKVIKLCEHFLSLNFFSRKEILNGKKHQETIYEKLNKIWFTSVRTYTKFNPKENQEYEVAKYVPFKCL
jgi:hypothetical protein